MQKPFWEASDEIDVEFYMQALVTLFRFLPEDESLPFFSLCLEPERSDAVKICVVKACLTLTLEVICAFRRWVVIRVTSSLTRLYFWFLFSRHDYRPKDLCINWLRLFAFVSAKFSRLFGPAH